MRSRKSVKKADTKPVTDRGEGPVMMEPLLLSEGSRKRLDLADLAIELAQKSAGFRQSLPEPLLASLADLLRAMNCYYSNLIEGHDTHPIDIERALKGDYSTDAKKRDLQKEARAHIVVQEWIDRGGLKGSPVALESILEIHRRFYQALPKDLLWIRDPYSKERVQIVPGELRQRDVAVGKHIAVSPPAVPRLLKRFEDVYGKLGKAETILAVAGAHHRLAWIHPFMDGNGRVARLMSHATLLEVLDTRGVWSIARGLARSVDAYKQHLDACDQPRRGDLDGRGQLSEAALAEFTKFFLSACLDQIAFMEGLMRPDQLRGRIRLWAEERIRLGSLPPRAGMILDALLYRGELPRGEAAEIVGTGDRQARRVVAALMEEGVLISESSRAPLRLAFTAKLAARWMPGLFPDKPAPDD